MPNGGHALAHTSATQDGSIFALGARDEAASSLAPMHILCVVAVIAVGLAARGAYHPAAQVVVATLIVAAVAGAHPRPRSVAGIAGLGRVAATAAMLAAWALVVAAATGRPTDSLPIVALLTGMFGLLVVSSLATPGQREALAGALVGLGGALALTGWCGVAFRLRPLADVYGGLWRAATTVTYVNAAAAVLAPVVLLALAGLTIARPPSAVVLATVLLTGAEATLSRGAALALAAGIVALCVTLRTATVLRTLGAPLCGALVALAALAPTMPAGAPPRPLFALVGLLAGVLVAVALARCRSFVLLAVVAAGLLGAATWSGAERTIAARLDVASPDRVKAGGATLDLLWASPALGSGPGRAAPIWVDGDGRTVAGRYAHNEYLQVAAELGLVGGGLVVALILAGSTMAREGRPFPAGQATPLWAGASAGLVALAVHSGFDLLWHVPIVPLLGSVLAGIAAAGAPPPCRCIELKEDIDQ